MNWQDLLTTFFSLAFTTLVGWLLSKIKSDYKKTTDKIGAIEKGLSNIILMEVRKSHKYFIDTKGFIDSEDYGQLYELAKYNRTLDCNHSHIGEIEKLMSELVRLQSYHKHHKECQDCEVNK